MHGRVAHVAAKPGSYAWISSSPLQVAGCLTVVSPGTLDSVAAAFGANLTDGRSAASVVGEGLVGDWAVFLQITGQDDPGLKATVVAEDNGFQGSRTEVLRLASRTSKAGLAASIFWNVNGVVIFSCAKRGKLVAAVELGLLGEEELASLPRPLRALARSSENHDQDLLAIGAAMVEQFTGVAFTDAVLHDGVAAELTPPAADLDDYDGVSPPAFISEHPDLIERLVEQLPGRQRLIAEWAATAAVHEAGLDDEPSVRAVIDKFDGASQVPIGSVLDAYRARLTKRADQIWHQEMETQKYGGLEGTFVHQQVWATQAVRQATHQDATSAAVTAIAALLGTVKNTRRERAVDFVEDERGRWETDVPDPTEDRVSTFVGVIEQLLASDLQEWPAIAAALPTPLTPDERDSALSRDAERLAAGEFDTWQFE